MSRRELEGMFGMFEMEQAVWQMIQAADAARIPLARLVVRPANFKDDALIGLCHLLYAEFIVPGYPNGEFRVGEGIIRRLKKKSCWESIPDAETTDQWVSRKLNFLKKGD